jgi:cytochrome oxidase Cu insertion factor (SCO1/SenC/PrrC family)
MDNCLDKKYSIFTTVTRLLLVGVIILLGLLQACRSTSSATVSGFGNAVGNQAYDFALPDLQGNIITLAGLTGHPVVLNFWSTG